MTAMRVAILSLHTSPLAPLGGRETGGMNVYVREVARLLGAAGVAVDVFTRRIDVATPEVEPLGQSGARLIHITAGPPERLEKEALPALTAAFADGVDAFRAREAGQRPDQRPDQCSDQGYDLIHSHYWLSAAAGDVLRNRWGVPHLAMFHTLAEVKLRARVSEREPEQRREAERRLVHLVDRIVVATEHERRLLRQLYRVPETKVSVIPLGVDRDRFQPRPRAAGTVAAVRQRLSLAAEERLVLAVGRLEPLKGFDILIRALGEMTQRGQVRLAIVGGDERAEAERHRLAAVASELGVTDRVSLAGSIPHEQLAGWYNAADVVAVPSFYESFGLVAVEALASGVPVVASRVGGLTSTVRDGRTGYLVPWRCPGPFAEKLDLLLTNEALRTSMGVAAAESMRPYAWTAITGELLDLYRATLEAHAVVRSAAAAVAGGA